MTDPVLVVGAGPAGLAAAGACAARGVDHLLVEAGPRRRDRVTPETLAMGVGGAGLFSDGKFSFAPAGAALWALPRRDRLRRAYAWVAALLERAGLAVEPFGAPAPPRVERFKPYPSRYLDLPRRLALIEALFAPVAERAWLGASLVGLEPVEGGVGATIEREGLRERVAARAVILATGRFGPLALPQIAPWLPRRFMRWEIGARLEADADHPFFEALSRAGGGIDPKLIWRRGAVEWRTFCCCQRGEVVAARIAGLWARSGRADGPPTGRSNVGINARLLDPMLEVDLSAIGGALFEAELSASRGLPLGAAAAPLHEGLAWLRRRYPSLDEGEVRLLGPTIEGVGDYPLTDDALKSRAAPIFTVGDAGGRFRGLVPALVSGALVGLHV